MSRHPNQSLDRAADLLVAEIAALPQGRRNVETLRFAARMLELAAYETARGGAPKQAPKLILMANDLMELAEAEGRAFDHSALDV